MSLMSLWLLSLLGRGSFKTGTGQCWEPNNGGMFLAVMWLNISLSTDDDDGDQEEEEEEGKEAHFDDKNEEGGELLTHSPPPPLSPP
mmetsp:Transcript_33565/g.69335  ORF Transcript_33565/g.69335 Transcript_33565/m.69335 type:complete len:87 (-) Transcript_33565:110-370(-)